MSTISCNEFIDQLDLWMEGERDPQARAHVRDCSHCRSFADDLDVIQSSAAALTVADPEPPARIWNALRTQLVEEGLIHEGIAAAPVPRQPSWFDGFFAAVPRPALAAAYLILLCALALGYLACYGAHWAVSHSPSYRMPGSGKS